MSDPTKVYVIPGRLVVGERMEDHEVESKTEAERLVATGGFALSAAEANAQAFTTPEATPADTKVLKHPLEASEEAPEPKPTKPDKE